MERIKPNDREMIIMDDPYNDVPLTSKQKKKFEKWFTKTMSKRLGSNNDHIEFFHSRIKDNGKNKTK
jgi:hypothetical protein